VALGHDRHVLLAAEDQADRPARGDGQERHLGAGRGGSVLLAAEAAAGDGLDDAGFVQPASQRRGHGLLHVERALHGPVDGGPGPLGDGDHAVRLDVGVLLVGRVVGRLDDDQVVPGEGRRHVPLHDSPLGQQLSPPGGLLGVEGRRQRLVAHVNRSEAVGQRLGGLRRHESDGLPHVTHLALGQDRPVLLDHGNEVLPRYVRGRDHRPHAGDAPGASEVQLGDPGAGMGRAERAADQGADVGEVLDVARSALDLVRGVRPPHALADDHDALLVTPRSMEEPGATIKRTRDRAAIGGRKPAPVDVESAQGLAGTRRYLRLVQLRWGCSGEPEREGVRTCVPR
jgi:hypothetical protein